MDNSLYISLSRQRGLLQQMDMIANNVANMNTNGYKSESLFFKEHIAGAGAGKNLSFSDSDVRKDMSPGQMQATYRDLDVAIAGEGFLVFNSALGPRYARTGSLVRGNDGTLVDGLGNAVLGAGGQPITLQEDDFGIVIREDGTVTVGPEADERGKLQVVTFEDTNALVKVDNGKYSTDQQPKPVDPDELIVQQGVLEKSNVNAIQEMTRMIKINRSVGTTASIQGDTHDLQVRTFQVYSRQ